MEETQNVAKQARNFTDTAKEWFNNGRNNFAEKIDNFTAQFVNESAAQFQEKLASMSKGLIDKGKAAIGKEIENSTSYALNSGKELLSSVADQLAKQRLASIESHAELEDLKPETVFNLMGKSEGLLSGIKNFFKNVAARVITAGSNMWATYRANFEAHTFKLDSVNYKKLRNKIAHEMADLLTLGFKKPKYATES